MQKEKGVRPSVFLLVVVMIIFSVAFISYGFRKPASLPVVESVVSKTNNNQLPAKGSSSVRATNNKQESEGDRKLRELGFDPKRGYPVSMVVQSNATNNSK